MDSYETTLEIDKWRGENASITVAMTANPMEETGEMVYRQDMDDYISKPVWFQLLFNIVKSTLSATKSVVRLAPCWKKAWILYSRERFAGGSSRELYDKLWSTLPGILEEMQKALASTDFNKIRSLAHQLKGSSGTLRIQKLYELFLELEQKATAEEKAACVDTLQLIYRLFKN